ncbi:MAG: PKD domain-containing protein, partial [Candidatus Omnitrophota bacterium]|nr:PKD domain-containing protein [Candidatus Omnitrophota bacterium]
RDRRAIPVFFEPGTNGPKKIVLTDTQEFASERLSCKTFTFDASQSYDPDSQEMIYFWDFGDGTTSKDIKTTHIYREAGKYLVKLTVIDNSAADCNTAMTKHVVNVNEPPQAVAKAVNLTCVGAEVSFDGTQSNDNPEDTLKYIWDFGDGETTEGAKVTHVYSKGGDYQVALTVKDDSDSACDTDIDKFGVAINTPPVAEAGEDINLCKEDPNDSLKVVFDGSSSKDEDEDSLIYSWDLGDGTVEQGKVISHNYEKGGEYLVKLLVTDDSGAECNSSESTKRIALNRAPMANAGKDLQICLSKEAHFDATTSYDNDGDPITCTWDFGDGETAQGFEVSHIYRNGGIYKVGLMVDDNSGTACSKTYDTLSIDVNSSPNAEIVAMNKGCVDNSVEFDGSSSKDPDGDELNYTWDFGDGTFARGANVKHSYAKGGLYKVALALEDGKKLDCSGAKKEHYININTPPVADAGPDRAICCVNKLVEFDASKSFDRDNDSLTYTWDLGDGQIKQGQKITHSYKDT